MVAAVRKQFLRHNTGEPAPVKILLPLIEIQNRRGHLTGRKRKDMREFSAVSLLTRIERPHRGEIPVKSRVTHTDRFQQMRGDIVLITLAAHFFDNEAKQVVVCIGVFKLLPRRIFERKGHDIRTERSRIHTAVNLVAVFIAQRLLQRVIRETGLHLEQLFQGDAITVGAITEIGSDCGIQ